MHSLPVNRQERLAFIELNLLFVGTVTRKKLKERFQISDAAATRDLIAYQSQFPLNSFYNNKLKAYEHCEDSFAQQFTLDVNVALLELTGNRQSLIRQENHSCFSFETLEVMTKPKVDIVSAVTRAMAKAVPIEIEYDSIKSGLRRTVIAPHSVVNNGERWHFRAYDREAELFSDFVVTRIVSVTTVESGLLSYEGKINDTEWNSEVRLVLVPHPSLVNANPIILDYAMQDGEHRVTVKAALLGYFLRHWNVDCSPENKLLEGKQYHLWLKNNEVILSYPQRVFAPGFDQHGIT
jgi:predicted DNA-binding transcriptional regulator YafY